MYEDFRPSGQMKTVKRQNFNAVSYQHLTCFKQAGTGATKDWIKVGGGRKTAYECFIIKRLSSQQVRMGRSSPLWKMTSSLFADSHDCSDKL